MDISKKIDKIEKDVATLNSILTDTVLQLQECKRHRIIQYEQEVINAKKIRYLEKHVKKCIENCHGK